MSARLAAFLSLVAVPAITIASSVNSTSSFAHLQRRGYWDDMEEALIDCPCASIFSKAAKCLATGAIGMLTEFSDERWLNCFCEEWDRTLDNCKNCISADNSRNAPTDDFKKLVYEGCKWGEYQPLMESIESASAASESAALEVSSLAIVSSLSSQSEAAAISSASVASVSSFAAAAASRSSASASWSSSLSAWRATHTDTAVPRGVSCPQELWDYRSQECRRDLTSTLAVSASASPTGSAGPAQTAGLQVAEDNNGNAASGKTVICEVVVALAVLTSGILLVP